MFSRLFLVLCAIALSSVLIESAQAEEKEETDDRNPVAIAIVSRILARIFVGAAKRCLSEAAIACQQHHSNVGKALSCGRDFLAANRGRCAVGK
ncbi:hypothetical protein TKK_0001461 [Trichogramma kaykai]